MKGFAPKSLLTLHKAPRALPSSSSNWSTCSVTMGAPSPVLVTSGVAFTNAWGLVSSAVSRDPEQDWHGRGYSGLCPGPLTPWQGPARQEEAAGGGSGRGQGKRNLGPSRSACLFLHPFPKGARTAGPRPSLSTNVIPRESGVFGNGPQAGDAQRPSVPQGGLNRGRSWPLESDSLA